MNGLKKYFLPVGILAVTAVLWHLIKANPPENKRGRPAPSAQMTVEVERIKPVDYQVIVDSFGVVKPRTNSALVAQVAGQITYVSPTFREGGFFEKGDVLLKIDDRDHQAEVKIAQSGFMTAKQQYLEEQARANQAGVDWSRLGSGKSASDLVLRKPQLAAAQAKMLSAEAQLEKAQLNLERTTVVAPFAGRILKQNVDIGQVVARNNTLAQIYAADYVEVRLPIKNNDLALMNLPETYRNEKAEQGQGSGIAVTLHSDLIGEQSWQGELVRTEGAIDSNAQQLYVVAQIADPYSSDHNAPVKIGQYVSAKIAGKNLQSALVIPSRAIYQGSYVYVVADGVLKRKEIETRWHNGIDSVIESGLEFGDELVLTSLGQVSSGTRVNVVGQGSQKGNREQRRERKKRDKKLDSSDKQTAITQTKTGQGDKS